MYVEREMYVDIHMCVYIYIQCLLCRAVPGRGEALEREAEAELRLERRGADVAWDIIMIIISIIIIDISIMYVCIYIYIYIHREREREREQYQHYHRPRGLTRRADCVLFEDPELDGTRSTKVDVCSDSLRRERCSTTG